MRRWLSHLVVKERVSAATQKQALNAAVFLSREVFKREPGDFSQFVHAKSRRTVPGGGLSADRLRWVRPKHAGYFLPQAALALRFRSRLKARLQQDHLALFTRIPPASGGGLGSPMSSRSAAASRR